MGQAPIMGGLCKFKAPNMGVICTIDYDNDNWLWQLTTKMTKDSKKDSKINLMLNLHCMWYSKEFCQNLYYSLPVN